MQRPRRQADEGAEPGPFSIWIRSGDKWQAVFHGENLIFDPKNPPKAEPAAPPKKPKEVEPKKDVKTAANSNTASSTAAPAKATPDANTDALVKVELALWEAWEAHDAKKLDDLMAKDVSFVNIFGTYLATRADALKDWTGT